MTNTEHEISVVGKMSLLKFLNTCLIPLIGNSSNSNWFDKHGLVEEVSFIVILLSISEMIRIIFHWEYVVKWILRTYQRRKGEKSEITQRQANYLYENDPAAMSKTLSIVYVFFFTILFFAPLIPGLTLFGILGSIFLYWTLKILMLRRKIVKRKLGAKVIIRTTEAIKFGILANAILAYIFFEKLIKTRRTPVLVSLILA